MTIERPMFPPAAESVDSFSLQPAIGSPKAKTSPVSLLSPLNRRCRARPSSSYALEPLTRRSKEPCTRAFRLGRPKASARSRPPSSRPQ
jgi:hypothetical protein